MINMVAKKSIAAFISDVTAKPALSKLSVASSEIAKGIKAVPEGMIRWTFGPATMPGQLCSKSNSRQIVVIGGRPALIKNKEARQYVQDFIRLFLQAGPAFEGFVRLTAIVYYADRRRDLDIALLQDCLQEGKEKRVGNKINRSGANIIKNDRQVVEIRALRMIDKLNPRTEFMLEEVTVEEVEEFAAVMLEGEI